MCKNYKPYWDWKRTQVCFLSAVVVLEKGGKTVVVVNSHNLYEDTFNRNAFVILLWVFIV